MSFISYAQNFEDVILWRALKHIEKGFYIDVGANDPSIESVTKAFYERGWHGINIEPLSGHFLDLQRERQRDINIRCAVGPEKGEIEIWECDVRGWASVDKSAIERHIEMGYVGTYHKVPMLPLAEICVQNEPEVIHFLKIDVEGFERSVLEGMDFKHFRPWIVVVEATRPNSPDEVYIQWEDLLLDANYGFAYADGLNRFYLAHEHKELLPALKYPPNVFDEFKLVAQKDAEARAADAEARTADAEARAADAEARTADAEARAADAEARAADAEAHLTAMINSRSWSVTKPLRATVSAWHRLKNELKKSVKFILRMASIAIMKQPLLKRVTQRVLEYFPSIRARLYRAITGTTKSDFSPMLIEPQELADLSPRGRNLFNALKRGVEGQKG